MVTVSAIGEEVTSIGGGRKLTAGEKALAVNNGLRPARAENSAATLAALNGVIPF